MMTYCVLCSIIQRGAVKNGNVVFSINISIIIRWYSSAFDVLFVLSAAAIS